MKEIVILGGGLSGLSAAYELLKNGFKVKIIEKEPQIGGLARCFKIGDTWLDIYYRHVFTSNKTYVEMVGELGLEDKLIWKKPKMGVYYNGDIYYMDALNLLFDFKPLNIIDKLGFGWMTFKVLIKNNWEDLDSITAKDWIIRNAGKKTFDVLFKPLLKEKWGKYGDKISAAWFWGRLKPRAQSRSSGFASEKLGYMENSFKTFNDALVGSIKEMKGGVEVGSEVTEIIVKNNSVAGVKYKKNGKEKTIKTDLVISTLPIPIFLNAAKNLEKKYKKQLEKIKYQGVICAVIGLKKNLSDIYWLNVCSESPFGGVIEHTNFIDKSNYNNQHIVYLFNYLESESEKWKLTDKKIVDEYLDGLKDLFPDFSKKDVLWFKVFKDWLATPIYEVNYGKYMPNIKTPVKGLYFAGVFKTYPLNRNMDTALKSGIETAKEIINS